MASETTVTSMKEKKRRCLLIVYLFMTLAACNNLEIVTEPLNPGLLLVSVDGKYGYRDTNGKMVVEPCFPIKTGEYSEGLATIPETCNTAGLWGYIDSTGQFMIKPQFRAAANFSEGLAGVQIGENWGFINKNGEIVIKPEYLSVRPFSEGLACVRLCGEYDGRYTCPYGYIDQQGKIVITPFTSHAGSFSEGLAVVEIDGKYGYIDKKSHMVIEPRFDFSVQNFSEGLARIRLNNKFGYIDKTGKIMVETKFEAAGDFSEGLAYAGMNGKYGFIDKTGDFIIPPTYDLILADTKFKQGLACVGVGEGDNQLFHYIDKTGKRITVASYNWCGNFRNDFASVDIAGETFYINTRGKQIW